MLHDVFTPAEVAAFFELILPSLLADVAGSALAEFELTGIDIGGLALPGVPGGTIWRASGLEISEGPRHVYARGDVGP